MLLVGAHHGEFWGLVAPSDATRTMPATANPMGKALPLARHAALAPNESTDQPWSVNKMASAVLPSGRVKDLVSLEGSTPCFTSVSN